MQQEALVTVSNSLATAGRIADLAREVNMARAHFSRIRTLPKINCTVSAILIIAAFGEPSADDLPEFNTLDDPTSNSVEAKESPQCDAVPAMDRSRHKHAVGHVSEGEILYNH